MSEHDPLCRWPGIQVRSTGPLGDIVFDGCDCDLIRKVRGDERERYKPMMTALTRQLLDQRMDLRAKVEALPVRHYGAVQWINRADVFASIDGSGND